MPRTIIKPRTRSLAIEGILTDDTIVREATNVTRQGLWAAEARLRRRYPWPPAPCRPCLHHCDYFYQGRKIIAVCVPDGWDGAGEWIAHDSYSEFEGLLMQHLGITQLLAECGPVDK
jgi:hypothetical protein